jgi:hypothetical protein
MVQRVPDHAGNGTQQQVSHLSSPSAYNRELKDPDGRIARHAPRNSYSSGVQLGGEATNCPWQDVGGGTGYDVHAPACSSKSSSSVHSGMVSTAEGDATSPGQGAQAITSSKSSSSVHSGLGYEHHCSSSSSRGVSSTKSMEGGGYGYQRAGEHACASPLAFPGWERQADGVVRFVGVAPKGSNSKPDLDSLSMRLQGMNEALSALSSLQ